MEAERLTRPMDPPAYPRYSSRDENSVGDGSEPLHRNTTLLVSKLVCHGPVSRIW